MGCHDYVNDKNIVMAGRSHLALADPSHLEGDWPSDRAIYRPWPLPSLRDSHTFYSVQKSFTRLLSQKAKVLDAGLPLSTGERIQWNFGAFEDVCLSEPRPIVS